MSPRLPVVTAKEVVRVATQLGFVLDRQKGSHAVYFRESDKARIVVPIHSGRTLKPKTLAGIIEDMGLSVEEFRNYL